MIHTHVQHIELSDDEEDCNINNTNIYEVSNYWI